MKNSDGTMRSNTLGQGGPGYKGNAAGAKSGAQTNKNNNGNSPTIKKTTTGAGLQTAGNVTGFGMGGAGLQLKPTVVDPCKFNINYYLNINFIFSFSHEQ